MRAISSRIPDRPYCSQKKKVDRSIRHFLTSVLKLYVTSSTSEQTSDGANQTATPIEQIIYNKPEEPCGVKHSDRSQHGK